VLSTVGTKITLENAEMRAAIRWRRICSSQKVQHETNSSHKNDTPTVMNNFHHKGKNQHNRAAIRWHRSCGVEE